ncbi:STY0301 family protein [Duganella sp. PWIR1]
MKIKLSEARLMAMAGVLMAPAYVFASDVVPLTCPDVIPAATVKVELVLDKWAPSVLSDFRLSSAGFNNGPPEKHADLKPYSVTEKRHRSVAIWRFDGDEFADGLWLACSYGGVAGEITLARKLPSGYRSCSVSYSPSRKAGAQVIEITCR